MKGINPLLYGLNSFYQQSGSFQASLLNNFQGSSSALSLIGSLKSETAISSQAKDISELYKVLKLTGNKEALKGLNDTVKALVKDTDKQSMGNFMSFAKEAVSRGKAREFVQMLADIHELNAADASGLGNTFARQVGKTYAQKGFTLAKELADTTRSLMSKDYGNAKEMASAVGDFLSTWKTGYAQAKKDKSADKA